jgi:hypothetical protein
VDCGISILLMPQMGQNQHERKVRIQHIPKSLLPSSWVDANSARPATFQFFAEPSRVKVAGL